MLRVELACQMFSREDGNLGKTSWPLEITEEQLSEVMSIPGVWTPNTRRSEQIDGVAIWACRSSVLLSTVLQSWKRRKAWVHWILEVLKTDPEFKRNWELRAIWTEDLNALTNEEILLTEVVSTPRVEEGILKKNRLPTDLSLEEIEVLVSNIGEENQLW